MVTKRCPFHLAVDSETFLLVTQTCVEEFYKENPTFKGMKVTHNFMVRRLADFYMNPHAKRDAPR